MFFFQAEKQSTYLEGWSMRNFAFDSQRRHLYYSERQKSTGNEATQHVVHWKKKLKVTRLFLVALVHEFRLDDPHLKEADLFSLKVHGKTRMLASGEPKEEPLLCSFDTDFPVSPAEEVLVERRRTLDPYHLRDLYEALRDQFAALQRNNVVGFGDTTSLNDRNASHSELRDVRTIQSPRSAAAGEHSITVTMRCQCEEDFVRLRYVMQTVLGYDRLCVRPFHGLPPYDPRNGIPLAHVPMHLWHTFKALDDSVFYALIRGDLVGRNSDGSAAVSLPGAYLCITHDMVLVVRENGMIPRWIRLHDVNVFESNTVAKRPFFAFLTDDPSPDILFIPRPPVFGSRAIAEFSGVEVVKSIRFVLEDTCFASTTIRRAIQFVDVDSTESVRAYFNVKDKLRRFKFTPLHGFDDSLSCLIPKVQLARVWRDVLNDQRARSQDDVAAIPLEGGASNRVLSSANMSSVRQRMNMENSRARSHDEIFGLPLRTLLESPRRRVNTALETPTIRPENFLEQERRQEEEEEVVYQHPDAHYYHAGTTLNVLQPCTECVFGPESHVDELVNTSLIAIGGNIERENTHAQNKR